MSDEREKMKAVVFEGEGKVAYKTVDKPAVAKPSDVLLKILATSICGSDLGLTAVPPKHPGKPGVILGHECVAEVVELGAPSRVFSPGDRVLVNPMIPCGECEECKMGRINTCLNVLCVGETCDGIFADYFVSEKNLLYPIDPSVPVDVAIYAEPIACVLNGFKRCNFLPGQSVLILGAGPMGLLYSKLAKAAGASRVFVTELSPFRLDFARQHAEADRVIDLNGEQLGEVVKDATKGGGFDLVVDTVGTRIAHAIDQVSIGGVILLFGLNDAARETIDQSRLNWKEATVVASIGTQYTFPLAIKLLESGRLNLGGLPTHRLPLSEAARGLEMLRNGEAMKVVMYPEGAAGV